MRLRNLQTFSASSTTRLSYRDSEGLEEWHDARVGYAVMTIRQAALSLVVASDRFQFRNRVVRRRGQTAQVTRHDRLMFDKRR